LTWFGEESLTSNERGVPDLVGLAQDIEWWTPSDLPDAGVHRGHDEVLKHLSAWSGSFDEFEVVPLEFFESRECVIVRLVLKGRLRGSTARVQHNDLAQVWRFRGDRVIEIREYRTLREAQSAAGVR
jgi:ketosteroid isomerase-like protein